MKRRFCFLFFFVELCLCLYVYVCVYVWGVVSWPRVDVVCSLPGKLWRCSRKLAPKSNAYTTDMLYAIGLDIELNIRN